MFRKLGRWVDKELAEVGCYRHDLRIHFRFRGRKYFYETFTLPWWLLVITTMVLTVAGLYLFATATISLEP